MKRGKKYSEAAKLVDSTMLYDAADAIDLVQKTSTTKFDATVEAHIRLGVDSRHADQQVRGAVVLPHGTGKTVRVLVRFRRCSSNSRYDGRCWPSGSCAGS